MSRGYAAMRRAAIRRRRLVLAATAAAVAGLFLLRALIGDYSIAVGDALRILGGEDLGVANFIFLQTMLPVSLAAAATGAMLGVSGAAFQAMLRNPLASPDVMGVTLGASAAAVSGLVFFSFTSVQASAAAFVGGLVVALSIHLLSGGANSASNRIILIGIGLAAALQAVVHWALLKGNIYQARDAMVWLSGSLNATGWDGVARAWVVLTVALPLLLMLGRALAVVESGDDLAGGLGVRVARARLAIMLLVVLLTSTATSVAGPIAFVALLSGPIARGLNRGRTSLPLAALVGAGIVLAADFAGDAVLPGPPMPVGVITGALGAPMLVALLLSTGRKENAHG